MSPPGFQVSPQALAEAARGIQDVLAGLRSFGVGIGDAEAGRGVVALRGHTGPVGHDALASAFDAFCGRWEWGVRTLVRAGAEMADGLGATAADYQDVDGRAWFDRLTGDPLGRSAAAAPDQAWAATGDDVARTWADTADDLAANSGPGLVARALDGENPLQESLDELHGIVE